MSSKNALAPTVVDMNSSFVEEGSVQVTPRWSGTGKPSHFKHGRSLGSRWSVKGTRTGRDSHFGVRCRAEFSLAPCPLEGSVGNGTPYHLGIVIARSPS